MKINFLKNWKEIILVAALFLTFLSTRLYRLSETPLYPDEITWMVRSKETALAIRTSNFKYFNNAWWNIKDDTESIAIPLTVSTGFPLIYLGKGQSVVSRNILQDYTVSRGSVILLASAFIVIYYFLIKKISDQKTAFITALLFILDPLFLANSKLVMNDIYLTMFVFISMCGYLVLKNNILSILISSLFLAFGFLTKPNALIVLPIMLISVFNKNDIFVGFKKLMAICITTFIFITLLWPPSWSNPIFAIPEYLFRQSSLVAGGINNFFMGSLTNNPPPYYYIFQIFSRLPSLIVLGLLVFIVNFFRRKEYLNKTIVSNYFFIFIILFTLIVSLSAKKLGVRYIMPVWPFLYFLSVKSLVEVSESITKIWIKNTLYIVAIAWFIFVAYKFFPYHDLYYNQLVGSSTNSRKVDLVGLCSGSKGGVDYALKCFPQVTQIAAIGCGSSTIPYYYPHKVTTDWKKEKVFIVETYYIQLQKDTELNSFVSKNKPTFTFRPNGVDMSYLYTKPDILNKCEVK